MQTINVEVCVVGAGPAGVVAALELARAGNEVLLIDSGGTSYDEKIQSLGDTPHFDPARHLPMNLVTRRQIGGASNIWGGRCVPFDPADFDHRPYIPYSEWPIRYEEISSYFPRASRWFFTGDAVFNMQDVPGVQHQTIVPGLPDEDVLSSTLERWSLPTNFGLHYAQELASTPRLRVESRLTCVEIQTDPDGKRVTGLRCRRLDNAEELRVEAQHYIIACGGLETARLLLASRSVHPAGLGNHSDQLGRFYMGHISGKIADVVFTTPPEKTAYAYERDPEGVYLRHRFSFSRSALHNEQIPNIVSWLVNPELANPVHRNGILSFAYLALSSPVFGKRFVAEGIRQASIGTGPRLLWPHVRNMLVDLPSTMVFVPTFAYRRFLAWRKAPGFFVPSAANRYPLHYHGEQVPNPESRVTLSTDTDALGLPKLVIDLRFGEQDVEGVIKAHQLWDSHLRRHGCGRLEYHSDDLRQKVWAQASDGYHQAGTTRMSKDPADGVVDENLSVHGMSNLHIASSSVFVTSSQANSTFMIVAFALRLADRLNSLLSK